MSKEARSSTRSGLNYIYFYKLLVQPVYTSLRSDRKERSRLFTSLALPALTFVSNIAIHPASTFLRPNIRYTITTMATSSVLYAAAKEIGATCDSENRRFLQCKAKDEEPSACLDKGEAVQACALGVLRAAMATCEQAFQSYVSCIDSQISEEYMFERCRKQEHAFAKCRQEARDAATANTKVS